MILERTSRQFFIKQQQHNTNTNGSLNPPPRPSLPNQHPFKQQGKPNTDNTYYYPDHTMPTFFLYLFILLSLLRSPTKAQTASGCNNLCSGHGTCDASGGTPTYKCTCFEGWGAADDIAEYKAPDCSQRKSTTVLLVFCENYFFQKI